MRLFLLAFTYSVVTVFGLLHVQSWVIGVLTCGPEGLAVALATTEASPMAVATAPSPCRTPSAGDASPAPIAPFPLPPECLQGDRGDRGRAPGVVLMPGVVPMPNAVDVGCVRVSPRGSPDPYRLPLLPRIPPRVEPAARSPGVGATPGDVWS